MGGFTRRLAAISTLRVVAPPRRVLGAESAVDHEIRAVDVSGLGAHFDRRSVTLRTIWHRSLLNI